MKSRKMGWDCRVTLTVSALLAMTTMGCPDDDTCSECSCDPSLCDGGDGGDADADSDGDVPPAAAMLHVETWTLSPDGTPRDLPGADAEVDGQHCTTPCDLELPVGAHDLYLTLSGWAQGPNPLPINLAADAVAVNEIPTSIVEVSGLAIRHRLERNLGGNWVSESSGDTQPWEMLPAPSDTWWCPDSRIQIGGGVDPMGFCIEGEVLSLCKSHASECSGISAEGRVLLDGRRVELTSYGIGLPQTFVYNKLD